MVSNRRDQYRVVGKTYVCNNCRNQNDEPMKNRKGEYYCSSCFVKTNVMHIMKKKDVILYKGKRKRVFT